MALETREESPTLEEPQAQPAHDEAQTSSRPEARTTQTGGAVAAVSAFDDDTALLDTLFAAVSARAAAAIAHRQWLGLLSRRGDAAAALFLDGDRVDGLLAGPASPPPADVIASAAAAQHAVDVLGSRIVVTDESAGPLARALRRWKLDPESTLLLGAALAAELSPRLARVLAYLGGDASRPGVTVDAAAALLGDGVPASLAVDARTRRGAPLFDLGLIAVRPLDLPLLRRTLAIAPRVAQLAAGVLALDPALAHAIATVAPLAASLPAAVELRIDAVLRATPPAIGIVRAARDAAPAERIADVAARRALALWQIDLRALADEGIERAVVREALLLGAALVIRVEPPGPGRDSWRIVPQLDRIAACVPSFVDVDDRAELEPLWSSPVIPIELTPLARDQQLVAWTQALGPGARMADLERARRVRASASAMKRTAGALAALSGAGASVPLVSLAIAQVMRDTSLPRVAPRELDDLVLPAAVRDRIEAVCHTARRSERLIVALIGRAGSGKTALAGAIASRLDAAAAMLDFGSLVGRLAELDRGLTELLMFAAAGGIAILDASDVPPPRRGLSGGPEVDLVGRRLATATGIVVLVVREPSAIDLVVRRCINETIELPALDAPTREAIWRRALAGSRDPAAAATAARALCELPLSIEQILRLAERALASGVTAPDALRAEALRLVRDAGHA